MDPVENKESPRPFMLPKVADDDALSLAATFPLGGTVEDFAAIDLF